MFLITPRQNTLVLEFTLGETATLLTVEVSTNTRVSLFYFSEALGLSWPSFCKLSGSTLFELLFSRLKMECMEVLDVCSPTKPHVSLQLAVFLIIKEDRC